MRTPAIGQALVCSTRQGVRSIGAGSCLLRSRSPPAWPLKTRRRRRARMVSAASHPRPFSSSLCCGEQPMYTKLQMTLNLLILCTYLTVTDSRHHKGRSTRLQATHLGLLLITPATANYLAFDCDLDPALGERASRSMPRRISVDKYLSRIFTMSITGHALSNALSCGNSMSACAHMKSESLSANVSIRTSSLISFNRVLRCWEKGFDTSSLRLTRSLM